jgi:rhodanese-related sulfurtransferase
MALAIAILCAVVLSAAVLIKRVRERREAERHGITAEALRELLDSNQELRLIDVRQPLDLLGDTVIIPGAQWLAPEELRANPSLLPKDCDFVVYCTCPSDKTSRIILHRALAMGFLRIRFLKGGLDGWKAKGFPVEPYTKPFRLNTDRGNRLSAAR